MVFLRRVQPKLICVEERADLERRLREARGNHRYKLEVRGKLLTIHEGTDRISGLMAELGPFFVRPLTEADRERFADYQAVLRSFLVDAEKRLFDPERFCFRGGVDDWISFGAPDTLGKLAAEFLKHLGKDSMYDLYWSGQSAGRPIPAPGPVFSFTKTNGVPHPQGEANA